MSEDEIKEIAALPTLAKRIVAARDRLGMSQLELSQRLGIGGRTLRRQEAGDVLPNFETAAAMIRVLGDWRIVFGLAMHEPPE